MRPQAGKDELSDRPGRDEPERRREGHSVAVAATAPCGEDGTPRAGLHGGRGTPRHVFRDRPMQRLPPELTAPDALAHILAAAPARPLRDVDGRTTFVWPGASGVIVKRYVRAGLARLAWRDVLSDLWNGALPKSAGRREALNLAGLARDGLPVPALLGCWEHAGRLRGAVAASAVAMQKIEHQEHLRQLAERDPRVALQHLHALALLVGHLHARGWHHRDLYLQHVIVEPLTQRLVLLDVGRARQRRRVARRWFVKDLAALQFSTPPTIGARARLRFLAAYLRARQLSDRAQKRRFRRDVLAKARRIARHVPRDVARARPGMTGAPGARPAAQTAPQTGAQTGPRLAHGAPMPRHQA